MYYVSLPNIIISI